MAGVDALALVRACRSRTPYAGWLHAFVMQYQVLPSFFFGFLLTMFPRWMGLPDFAALALPARSASACSAASWRRCSARSDWSAGIVVGALLTLAGWIAGLAALGPLLLRETAAATWHARSCFAALMLGLVGLLAWMRVPARRVAAVGVRQHQDRQLRPAAAGVS